MPISPVAREAQAIKRRAELDARLNITLSAIKQPMTVVAISRATGVGLKTTFHYISLLRAEGRMHIVHWVRGGARGQPSTCYVCGGGVDVPKPARLADCLPIEEFDEDLAPRRIAPAFVPFRSMDVTALFGPYRPAVQGEAR